MTANRARLETSTTHAQRVDNYDRLRRYFTTFTVQRPLFRLERRRADSTTRAPS